MIQINVSTSKQTNTAVLPLSSGQQFSASGQAVQNNESISHFLASNEHQGDFGFTRTIYEENSRTLIVGSGDESKLTLQKLRALSATTARKLNKNSVSQADVYLAEVNVVGASVEDKVQAIAEGFWLGL